MGTLKDHRLVWWILSDAHWVPSQPDSEILNQLSEPALTPSHPPEDRYQLLHRVVSLCMRLELTVGASSHVLHHGAWSGVSKDSSGGLDHGQVKRHGLVKRHGQMKRDSDSPWWPSGHWFQVAVIVLPSWTSQVCRFSPEP